MTRGDLRCAVAAFLAAALAGTVAFAGSETPVVMQGGFDAVPDAAFADAAAFASAQVLAGGGGDAAVSGWRDVIDGSALSLRNWQGAVQAPWGQFWLFFIDDDPHANWEHPCRYVFVARDLSAFGVACARTPIRVLRPGGERVPPEVLLPAAPPVESAARPASPPVAGNAIDYGAGSAADCHAVIISGGFDKANNHIRYWGDAAFIYSTLTKKYGYPDNQIHALVSDGTDPAADRSNNTDSPIDLDGDGDADTDYACTYANVASVFSSLRATLTADSQLLVFVTDHGGQESGYDALIYLWGDTLKDDQLANMTTDLPCPVMFVMETCYSGGFIDDLNQGNRAIATACDYDETSKAGNTYPVYDQWCYQWTAAVRGYYPGANPWDDRTPCNADADTDGCVSFREAFNYAYSKAPWQDTPQYGENPGGLGDRLSMRILASGTGNDDFANAYLRSGAAWTAGGINGGATKESGEPDHAGNAGGHSLWWNWTAPYGGEVTLATDGSDFDTLMAVYTGSSVGGLIPVAGDDDGGSGTCSRVTFIANGNTTYRLAVDGKNGATGNVSLSLSLQGSAAPPNDHFANAIAIAGVDATRTGASANASKEAGEPDHAGNAGGRSVWWNWTAPSSEIVTITTDGSAFDTLLAVYTGSSVSSLLLAAGDDDSGSGTRSRVSFTAASGTTYRVAVDGYGGAYGNITLSLSTGGGTRPANDDFVGAAIIAGGPVTVTGLNASATSEALEPRHGGVGGGQSAWWRWTVPSSGTVTIHTRDSNFDTVLAVYAGNTVGALTQVAANDDEGDSIPTSLVTFSALVATTYRIAVDGYNGATGNVSLTVIPPSALSEPVLSLPADGATVTTKRPRLAWQSLEGATWYYVYIGGSGGGYDAFWTTSTAWTPTVDLPPDAYTWWVRGWNADGYGPWSSARHFTVPLMLPGSCSPTWPTQGSSVTDRTPTFSWSAGSPPASWYYLWVNRGSEPVHKVWVKGNRFWTPGSDLEGGDYHWWVRTWNADGYGPWSGEATFTIPVEVPAKITLVSPAGTLDATTATFTWNADASATWYRLYCSGSGAVMVDKWYGISQGSGQIQRTWTGFARDRTYTWWVRGWAPDGYGPWSDAMQFTVEGGKPGKVTLVSPQGTTAQGTTVFKWNTAARAEWYRVYVQKGATVVVDKWVEGATLYQVAAHHSPGTYTWWVCGWNSWEGYGPWSTPMEFAVADWNYLEDFNDGQAQGWLPDNPAHWSVQGNRYRSYHASPGALQAMVSRYDQVFGDGTYRLDVSKRVGAVFPKYLLFNCSANFDGGAGDADFVGSTYGVGVDNNRSFLVFKVVNGVLSTLKNWTYSSRVNPADSDDRLEAVVNGSRIDVYINGHWVYGGNDSSVPAGRLGCMGYTWPDAIEEHLFDNANFVPEP